MDVNGMIICMGDKQLLASVNSIQPAPRHHCSATAPAQRPRSKSTRQITNAMANNCNISCAPPDLLASRGTEVAVSRLQRPRSKSTPQITNAMANNCNISFAPPDLLAPSAAPKFPFPDYKPPRRSPLTTDARASEQNILPKSRSQQFQPVERTCSFHPDYIAGTGSSLPSPLPRPNGKLNIGGAGKPVIERTEHGTAAVLQSHNIASSARQHASAKFLSGYARPRRLRRLRSECTHHYSFSSDTCSSGACAHCWFPVLRISVAEPLASASEPQHPVPIRRHHQHWAPGAVRCIPVASVFNLRRPGFPRTATSCGDHKSPKGLNPFLNPVSNASPACNFQAEKENRSHPSVEATNLVSPNYADGANKLPVSGTSSHEKSKEKFSSSSYSSANVHNSLALARGDGEGVESELPNAGSQLVFLVNRRSKTRPHGVGTHHLRMSDLSAYFHLSVVNAAKKLRVSQTTLKKACRKLALKRWPGLKVRSLESATRGLEHTIVVGQGACLKEFSKAYIRSEVCKLQQEMDQLVPGTRNTPAQVTQKMHSPAVRIVELYKRLYFHGWRSRYQSAGRPDMITPNTSGNPNKFALPTKRKYRRVPKENQHRRALRKAITASKQHPTFLRGLGKDLAPRDTVMNDCDIEGLLLEVHDIHVKEDEAPAPETIFFGKNGIPSSSPKTTSGDEQEVFVEDTVVVERSAKRRKRECQNDAEVGVVVSVQGLSSGTCAV